MNPTETQIKLERYKSTESEVDEFGRRIVIRRLKPSEQTKIAGMTPDLTGSDEVDEELPKLNEDGEPVRDAATSAPVMVKTGKTVRVSHRLPLLIAASVTLIDDAHFPFPQTRAQLDAVYDRLDVEGLKAAAAAWARFQAREAVSPQTVVAEAKLVGDVNFRQILWAVRNGVPYDVAYVLTEAELAAHAIVFSQFENGNLEWDWEGMRFIPK